MTSDSEAYPLGIEPSYIRLTGGYTHQRCERYNMLQGADSNRHYLD